MLVAKDARFDDLVIRGARVVDPGEGIDANLKLTIEQVRSGLVVRMAVLYDLLTTGPAPVPVEAALEVA